MLFSGTLKWLAVTLVSRLTPRRWPECYGQSHAGSESAA
jgi:hypothetical protein